MDWKAPFFTSEVSGKATSYVQNASLEAYKCACACPLTLKAMKAIGSGTL